MYGFTGDREGGGGKRGGKVSLCQDTVLRSRSSLQIMDIFMQSITERKLLAAERASSKLRITSTGEADLDDCVAAAKYLAVTLDFIDEEKE